MCQHFLIFWNIMNNERIAYSIFLVKIDSWKNDFI